MIGTFDKYLNEKTDLTKNYVNYVFNMGIFQAENKFQFSWQYVSQFNKSGAITLKASPEVVFQFIQGVPVISVPSNKSRNVVIDDVAKFAESSEYKTLSKSVSFRIDPKILGNLK